MFFNSKNQLWDFKKIIKDLFDFKIDYNDLFKLNFLDYKILGKLDNKYNLRRNKRRNSFIAYNE